jgi:hypothetical protein
MSEAILQSWKTTRVVTITSRIKLFLDYDTNTDRGQKRNQGRS